MRMRKQQRGSVCTHFCSQLFMQLHLHTPKGNRVVFKANRCSYLETELHFY